MKTSELLQEVRDHPGLFNKSYPSRYKLSVFNFNALNKAIEYFKQIESEEKDGKENK